MIDLMINQVVIWRNLQNQQKAQEKLKRSFRVLGTNSVNVMKDTSYEIKIINRFIYASLSNDENCHWWE